MKLLRTALVIMFTALLLASCEQGVDDEAEDVADAMGDLAEQTADEVEDAANNTADTLEDSCEDVVDAANADNLDC